MNGWTIWRVSLAALLAVCAAGCAGRINDQVWRKFAMWAFSTWLGSSISNSTWLFAVIEAFHLTGLALLGGAVLLVDFRLLGVGLSNQSMPKLARSAEPWLLAGLALAVVSGVLLFFSEATKFYSRGFWDSAEAPFIYKMLFLILAVGFTFTIRRTVLHAPEPQLAPSGTRERLVGLSSMLLWLGVGVGGRAIGFY
jgi:hypothetical protein